jgi:hypothetical protein
MSKERRYRNVMHNRQYPLDVFRKRTSYEGVTAVMKMEDEYSSETLVSTHNYTRRYYPEQQHGII